VNNKVKWFYVTFPAQPGCFNDDILITVGRPLVFLSLDCGQVVKILAHHLCHKLYPGQLRRCIPADKLAVSQHCDFIAYCINLFQEVGNEDDSNSLRPELPHQLKKLFHLSVIQRGSRFIQYQNLCRHIDGAGYCDHLLNCDGVVVNRLRNVCIYIKAAKQLACFPVHGLPVNQSSLSRLSADKKVFCDCQVGTEVNLLVYGADTFLLCFLGAAVDNCVLTAFNHDFPCFKLLNSCQNFNQRGFSRAVFTHQGMYLTFFQGEIHILQSFYTRECLIYVPHFKNGILFHKSFASSFLIAAHYFRHQKGDAGRKPKPPAPRLLINQSILGYVL